MKTPIHTAYCRYRGELPEDLNVATAIEGFDTLGIRIVPFYGFGDVEESVECGPSALVCGYIGDVHKALTKMGIPIPPSLDYPEELQEFYGRKIWSGTLSEIRDKNHQGVFVKPCEQKLFTGLIWHGTRANRLTLATYPDDTPCFFSDVVPFVSEYRVFVLDRQIVGVRFYKGDWSVAPSRQTVEAAVAAYPGPIAHTVDVGITSEGKTLIVEVNDGFAMGTYGLSGEIYARMLEARWEEMTASLCEKSQ